ncbi:hypothetical protein [Hymenobacter sp.]|jgi:hypothetical protein|uniref:hypothetical protein n=1 Tax=Hymenobacter sp. TaxID=1898978 RepID=UPI002EDA81FC
MRQLFTLLLLSAATSALGQTPATSAPDPAPRARPWYRPGHVVLQTAGGIGMVAAGVGYTLLHDRLEADILFGYVPEKYAGSSLSIATLKALYTPYSINLSEKFQVRPLTLGLYVSYTGGVINEGETGQYPEGYYWFSRDTRFGPLLGSRLTYRYASATHPERQRRISAYYELGSNDLYLTSYFSNANRKALSPFDIMTLGFGLKMDF